MSYEARRRRLAAARMLGGRPTLVTVEHFNWLRGEIGLSLEASLRLEGWRACDARIETLALESECVADRLNDERAMAGRNCASRWEMGG